MSQYVHVDVPIESREELLAALSACGLVHQVAGAEGLVLEGSVECAGDPVDVRVAPEAAETVQDWGFSYENGRVMLVCADVDRPRLERQIVPRITAEIVRARLTAAGHHTRTVVDADGRHRIVVGVEDES
ncbi:MAG: hypothetical protein D6705_17830 [Deltaproteobacteria bacterium]|nr:MAG: hypothetical protein D6705_17830 [Deltaproteobacteria bacterium]